MNQGDNTELPKASPSTPPTTDIEDRGELTFSDCHQAHIYIKDWGFPPDEIGFNCSVCDKKCSAAPNPKWGIVGRLQLLIPRKLDDVANEIEALIYKATDEAVRAAGMDK